MANMLDKYKDAMDEASAPSDDSAIKSKQQYVLRKKELKILKKLTKTLRKHDKLMKQETGRRKAEEDAAEKTAKCKKGDTEKGFLSSFAKAICKVLPQIVTAAITGILGFFFKSKSFGKTLQTA